MFHLCPLNKWTEALIRSEFQLDNRECIRCLTTINAGIVPALVRTASLLSMTTSMRRRVTFDATSAIVGLDNRSIFNGIRTPK